jgi:hypothetical protein
MTPTRNGRVGITAVLAASAALIGCAADQPAQASFAEEPRETQATADRTEGGAFTLPKGTVLKVRTSSPLTSKTARAGDGFVAHLFEPLKAGNCPCPLG